METVKVDFFAMLRTHRIVSLAPHGRPISVGIVPVRPLLLRAKISMLFKFPNSVGTEPCKEFVFKRLCEAV